MKSLAGLVYAGPALCYLPVEERESGMDEGTRRCRPVGQETGDIFAPKLVRYCLT